MSKIRPPEEVAEHLLRLALAQPPDARLPNRVTCAELAGAALRLLRGRTCIECESDFGENQDCVVCWIARTMEAGPRTTEELEQAVAAERARRAAAQDESRKGER